MSTQCCAPDCTNNASTGPLCFQCEKRWMAERSEVVDAADHLTDLAAQFAAYCLERGLPDPFAD